MGLNDMMNMSLVLSHSIVVHSYLHDMLRIQLLPLHSRVVTYLLDVLLRMLQAQLPEPLLTAASRFSI